MKLAEFLAGCVKREMEQHTRMVVFANLKAVIQAGIEAFASTEGVEVQVIDRKQYIKETFV